MRIVTLIENTTGRADLATEHGLSLYIEANGKRLLFDAGQSGAFADNAQRLGIDLSRVDAAILSHGHYDHGGGLRRFLEINTDAPVYVRRSAFGDFLNTKEAYIGLDKTLMEEGRVVFVDRALEPAPGMTLLSGNDRFQAWPVDPAGLTMLENGIRRPDDFRHEQYLLIEENGKKVLISGCSHRGILNIADWFRTDVLVGGFHFMKLDPMADTLTDAARQLMAHPTVYYTGHCTGDAQYARMKTIMGERLRSLTTGQEIMI